MILNFVELEKNYFLDKRGIEIKIYILRSLILYIKIYVSSFERIVKNIIVFLMYEV